MHLRLLTNLSFRNFDLPLRPSLHRLPPQKPHLLDDPLFGRVRLLEISLRILYGAAMRIDLEDQGASPEMPKTPRR
jgi:hypothetical protein